MFIVMTKKETFFTICMRIEIIFWKINIFIFFLFVVALSRYDTKNQMPRRVLIKNIYD